ncbi:MAG: SDR family oxidoreductase [Actinomycetota bacterium]|nr:SDR family oxidoreductase [Actinomycetota bacterium]
MDLGLEGRVAWVLGGSTGIGRAVAFSMASEGARVAISARDEKRLSETADEITRAQKSVCTAVPADVTDPDAIRDAAARIASELGPVDVLVANAGGPPLGTHDSLEDGDFAAAFDLSLRSAWLLARCVIPSMKERRSGCLVFMTSSSVKEVIDGLALSNTMRPAVVGLAKTLSRELGPHGVRVVCVAPGRTETDRVRILDEAAAAATGRSPDEVRRANESSVPLGRYARPEEISDVVAFVASERASYLTGVTLLVDGGASRGVLS